MNPNELLPLYRRTLLDDVIPFWLRHAIDPDGGITTCIGDDGSILSREKHLWGQWRAVWVFSTLYNRIERRPEWLETAWHITDFCRRYGWDDAEQGWVLRLDHEGKVIEGHTSIYTDGFAIYGLVQLALASGDEEALALARRTADCVLKRLATQPADQIPHEPYPIPPGARVHGVPMIFFLILWELGQATGEQRYLDAAVAMADDVVTHFYRPDRDLLLERISLDNGEIPPPLGTVVVPGHVVEGMWFQLHLARDRGDTARVAEACRLIRRHLEVGWDETYGGLLLAIDADGGEEIGWKFPHHKSWWPHTEAMYALLLAHELCGEPWCAEWYDRIHEYAFSHYPDREHGEWRQRLDREGRPDTAVLAFPVKDPFHLPRALILGIEVLERLVRG